MKYARVQLLLLPLLIMASAQMVSAQDAQSRLWDAAIAGDTAAIRKAVADGARVDSLDTRTNRNGRYALNWAAWYNRVDAVKLLIALKASLEAENNTGFTALSHAAEHGSLEAARILLDGGADPDHANQSGNTPQVIAEARGHTALATLLEAAPRKKK